MTLRILERRGTPAPDAVRERVRARTGPGRLGLRAQRAVHAEKAEDLFGGRPADPPAPSGKSRREETFDRGRPSP